jgi:hypothetical protein
MTTHHLPFYHSPLTTQRNLVHSTLFARISFFSPENRHAPALFAQTLDQLDLIIFLAGKSRGAGNKPGKMYRLHKPVVGVFVRIGWT